jgi:hypothetical protein
MAGHLSTWAKEVGIRFLKDFAPQAPPSTVVDNPSRDQGSNDN